MPPHVDSAIIRFVLTLLVFYFSCLGGPTNDSVLHIAYRRVQGRSLHSFFAGVLRLAVIDTNCPRGVTFIFWDYDILRGWKINQPITQLRISEFPWCVFRKKECVLRRWERK